MLVMLEDEEGLGLLGYYLLQVPHNTEGCVLLGGEARGHTEGVGHTSIVVTLVTGSSLGMSDEKYINKIKNICSKANIRTIFAQTTKTNSLLITCSP